MEIVLIILVVAIIVVGLFFKDFKYSVYLLGILEIFFRLIYKIASLLKINELTIFINTYIPSSWESVINSYSSGFINMVLIWALIFLFIYFEWYLIRIWLKKKM